MFSLVLTYSLRKVTKMRLICKVRLLSVVALLGAVALTGCGPPGIPSGTVSGTVTLEGQPVESGEISFVSSAGAAASGSITNGQFTLENSLPTGKYAVGIAPTALTEAPGEGGDTIAAPTSSVPIGYHMPGTSGLSQDIQEGPNTITMDLKKSGPPATGNPLEAAP